MPLPTNRNTSSTVQEHLDDHNTALHVLYNALEGVAILGDPGDVIQVNAGGTAVEWAAPSGSLVVAKARRTAGNLTLNSTSWADAGLADLTIAAVAGDILQVGLSMNVRPAAANDVLRMDVATIVSASPVNYLATGGAAGDFGVACWYLEGNPAVDTPLGGGPQPYTVQAGDISGGNVVLRLRYKVGAAGDSFSAYANATLPADFWVVNLG